MTRPAEVTEYLRCGGVNCDNACASMFDRLGVEDCKTWRVHGYVQQLEERIVHLEALNQQNLSVITMQERTRARLEERISQLDSCIPRWISVEERLAKHGAIVLCYTKYFYEVLQWDDDAEQWVGQHSVNAKHYVTHWMPLPEPPKEG